jgi:hypothetical protein
MDDGYSWQSILLLLTIIMFRVQSIPKACRNRHFAYVDTDANGMPYYVGSGGYRRIRLVARKNSPPAVDRGARSIVCVGERDYCELIERRLIEVYGLRASGGLLLNRTADGRAGGPRGRLVTDAARAKIAASLRGHAVSPETRAKIGRDSAARSVAIREATGRSVSRFAAERRAYAAATGVTLPLNKITAAMIAEWKSLKGDCHAA